MDGLPTAKGTFNWDGITDGQLGWAGVGQYHDQVNPCAFLLWMGAIANGGKAAEPYLIRKTVSSLGIPSLPHITQRTGQLIDSRTAATVADFMANNVTETYGTKRFPNMELCAKSGTAEVGTGQTPHAWFAGFLRNEDMKKDIWLKPGKELNTGAIIGGIGFAIYIALSALEWRGLALFAALAFGLEAGYAFLSALDCREKDKDSVSYNIVWGTGALAILMLLPAVMTIIKG